MRNWSQETIKRLKLEVVATEVALCSTQLPISNLKTTLPQLCEPASSILRHMTSLTLELVTILLSLRTLRSSKFIGDLTLYTVVTKVIDSAGTVQLGRQKRIFTLIRSELRTVITSTNLSHSISQPLYAQTVASRESNRSSISLTSDSEIFRKILLKLKPYKKLKFS